MYNVNEEYKINDDFKGYVERYANVHNLTPEEAMSHMVVIVVGRAFYDKRMDV